MSYLFGAMHISRSFVVLRSTLGEGVGSAEVIVISVDFPIIDHQFTFTYNLTLLFLIGVEGGLVFLQTINIGNIFSDKSLKLQRASPPGLVLSCELCEKFPDNRQERGGRSRI